MVILAKREVVLEQEKVRGSGSRGVGGGCGGYGGGRSSTRGDGDSNSDGDVGGLTDEVLLERRPVVVSATCGWHCRTAPPRTTARAKNRGGWRVGGRWGGPTTAAASPPPCIVSGTAKREGHGGSDTRLSQGTSQLAHTGDG